jgi:hypothetical protein
VCALHTRSENFLFPSWFSRRFRVLLPLIAKLTAYAPVKPKERFRSSFHAQSSTREWRSSRSIRSSSSKR